MRRPGRIPVNAHYKSEAVWAVATLCITLVLLVAFAIVGAKPAVAPGPPAPVVPPGTKGGAEIQAELDELTKRAEAAEADAKYSKEEEAQKESELASTKADLASAVQAKKDLEAEIQSMASHNGTKRAAALKSLEAKLAATQTQLSDAQAEAKKEAEEAKKEASQRRAVEAKLKEVQEELAKTKAGGSPAPEPAGQASFGDGYLQALSRPWYMAFVLGVAGALGVLGPSVYVRVYLPVMGSLIGGLMIAGFFEYMGSASGVTLFDAMMVVLSGSSGWFVEFIWLGIFALGIARWVSGVECSLWEFVDDVVVSESVQDKTQPLLGCSPSRQP